jgi:pyruvate dehydrogenase phosphatase
MSTALSKTLTSAVALELDKVFSPGADFSSDAVMHAIKNSFLKVDDYFVWQRHEELLQHPPPDSSITRDPLSLPATNLLQEALAGSCALLSIYDYQSRLFYVAVAGDSRAVLGRRSGKNTWTATALSRDQFSFNPDEKARIQSQHPGELDVLRKGRLLGLLEPTRAFGDMYFKWTDEMQNMIRTRYLNDHNQARQTVPNTTPPYLTAEPVVTTTSIRPEKDDFIVMASDGLWELLSNEEVVGLVGQWIDGQKDKCDVGGKGIVITASTSDSTDQKGPDSNRLGVFSPSERFTCEDSNAATHLLRNALGGKLHQGQTFRAMLTLSSPLSRAYRDDLTVMVLFFGEMPGDGGSITNSSA